MPYDVIEFRAFRPIGGKKPTERDTRETNTFPRPCKPAHPCAYLTLQGRGFYMEVRYHDNEEKDGGKDRDEARRRAQDARVRTDFCGSARGYADAVGS